MAQLRNFSLRTAISVGIPVVLVVFLYFAYDARLESFEYTWYPDETYVPAKRFPVADASGNPRVVLVRTSNFIECHEIYYSRDLDRVVRINPGQPVRVSYRVRIRFGKPYWIETIETAGIPNLTASYSGEYRTGNVGPANCF